MRNFIFLSQSLTINEKKKLTARERPVSDATFIKGRGEGVSGYPGVETVEAPSPKATGRLDHTGAEFQPCAETHGALIGSRTG